MEEVAPADDAAADEMPMEDLAPADDAAATKCLWKTLLRPMTAAPKMPAVTRAAAKATPAR